jgi:hypothetical protein
MKYFYLYIFILVIFILTVSVYNQFISENIKREGLENNENNNIILLGDSILKNNSYVSYGKSIDEILNEKTNGMTHCFALDGSTIVDTYQQLNQIPVELNKPTTTIFLSSGGNDIISKYIENTIDHNDSNTLDTIFGAYRNLIKSIKTKMNQSKIVLLDIYYPESIKYKQYHPIIKEWNERIYEYSNDTKNGINHVLKTSKVLTKSEDFTLNIEPSQTGGDKIANSILELIKS